MAIAGLLLVPGAQAATLTVNSLADPADGGSCTLPQAIDSIHAGSELGGGVGEGDGFGVNDRILFDASVTGSIVLTAGALQVEQSLDIAGPGAAQLATNGNVA